MCRTRCIVLPIRTVFDYKFIQFDNFCNKNLFNYYITYFFIELFLIEHGFFFNDRVLYLVPISMVFSKSHTFFRIQYWAYSRARQSKKNWNRKLLFFDVEKPSVSIEVHHQTILNGCEDNTFHSIAIVYSTVSHGKIFEKLFFGLRFPLR